MKIHLIFSRTLLRRRETESLTQKEVADGCELSLRGYQKLENGQTKPTLETAVALSRFLNFSLDEIRDEAYAHKDSAQSEQGWRQGVCT